MILVTGPTTGPFINFIFVYHMSKDSRLLLYFENTSFYARGIILFCFIYPSHPKGRSVKILSDIKPVGAAKKVGDP